MKSRIIALSLVLCGLLFAGCVALTQRGTKDAIAALQEQKALQTAILDCFFPPEFKGKGHVKIFTPIPIEITAEGLERVAATSELAAHWKFTFLELSGFSQFNANTLQLDGRQTTGP